MCISEFKLAITFLCWRSTVREPASVRFVSALNVSELHSEHEAGVISLNLKVLREINE